MPKFIYMLKNHPILFSIVGIQLFVILYINFFRLQYHIGYDCSAYYLQPIEMWRQKTLIPNNWDFQTTLYWDSPVVFAAILYGLFDNIFIAYGIANLISLCFLVWVLNAFCCQIGLTIRSKLFFFILFFSPYVAYANSYNDLEYFNMLFISCGAYSIKIAILFFIWLVFYRLNKEKIVGNLKIIYAISLFLCFVTGISSGYYVLIFGVVPIALYYIFRSCVEDKWLKEYSSSLIYIILCSIILLAGKFFATNVLGFESRDSIAIWTNISIFFDNLFSIFGGYFSLTGALPLNWSNAILSTTGIQYLFRLVMALGVMFCGLYFISKKIQGNLCCLESILFWILLGNILVFIFCYTKYGAEIFEDRYLIPVFVVLMISFSCWLDGVLIKSNNKSIKRVLGVIFLSCVLVINISSWDWIYKSKNAFDYYDKIINLVSELSGSVVYVVDDVLTARNLRVLDDDRIYKSSKDLKTVEHWGDYTYYDDNAEYDGPTILVCNNSTFTSLPIYLQNQYSLINKIDEMNTGIYYSERNPVDFSVGFSDSGFSRDLMYTKGMFVNELGIFDNDGDFLIDGINNHAFWGPYIPVERGIYNFTLNYEIVTNYNGIDDVGFFDVAIAGQSYYGNNIIANSDSVILSNVVFTDEQIGKLLEYRAYIYGNEGIKIKIKSVEIERISE